MTTNFDKFKDFTATKLEELKKAFAMGFTDEEACLYAEVGVRRFYDYCSENQDFRELKELLKQKPKIKAKINLLESINSNNVLTRKQTIEDSKWYLERKAKDEFSLRSEVEGTFEHENIMKVEYISAEHSKYDENGEIIK